jgi:hypothetical protein
MPWFFSPGSGETVKTVNKFSFSFARNFLSSTAVGETLTIRFDKPD